MLHEPDFATIAALIGDPSRALILNALLSGEALPASELAYRAHITPQTASSHLAKLLDAKLIKVNAMGRHACLDWSERRFHIAGSLGAVIADLFFENDWVKRLPHTRALKITTKGEIVLKQDFAITFDTLGVI